jgi:hypothetical protein
VFYFVLVCGFNAGFKDFLELFWEHRFIKLGKFYL